MSDPYLGEIRMFGGNYAPRNWAFCSGALINISDNNALYSLIGTNYGGDGRVTFALPDMRGRLPMGQGHGPGLSARMIGQRFGVERVTLSNNQMPTHTHAFRASLDESNSSNPGGDVPASHSDGDMPYTAAPTDPSRFQNLSSASVTLTGDAASHYNVMPFQCVNFIICLHGIYPSRP